MKSLLISILIFVFSLGVAAGAEGDDLWEEEEPVTIGTPFCPKTKISDNAQCLRCHVAPDFSLKEALPERHLEMPYGMKLVEGIPYYTIEAIDSDGLQEVFNYLLWHEYKHIVIEVHSPGGSLLSAWKIIGLMNHLKTRGIIVETRCYGFAASAGFLVFVNGSIGHRKVNPMASFMWHELWSIAFLKLETPSKKEDEAEVFRFLQDTIHNWLVTRSTKAVSKEQLDDWVRYKDKWFSGNQMIDWGFAEGVPE